MTTTETVLLASTLLGIFGTSYFFAKWDRSITAHLLALRRQQAFEEELRAAVDELKEASEKAYPKKPEQSPCAPR